MATGESSNQYLDSNFENNDNECVKCNLLKKNDSDLQCFSVENVKNKVRSFNDIQLCEITDKKDMCTDPCEDSNGSTVSNKVKLENDTLSYNESTLESDFKKKGSFQAATNVIIEASDYNPDPEDTIEKSVSLQNSEFLRGTNVSDIFHSQCFSINTPLKDISKINMFKTGVTYTSTPLQDHSRKNEFKKLSIVKEEEEEEYKREESENSKVEVIDNLNQIKSDLSRNPSKEFRGDPSILNSSQTNANLSVFKKDELSLLIDLQNETILKESRNNQSLTLLVKNNESVIYKNVVDKTIDEFLIENGELISIKELNNLEIKSDREEILSKDRARKIFISSNDDENKDNNDPEWELLKKLETDDERYKAVRKIWRNLAIPNLKQNLSTFNWRKKNSLPALKNIKPINANQIGKKKKELTYDCTEVFDIGIKNLHDLYNRQHQGIQDLRDDDTSILASLNKKPRLETEYAQMARRSQQSDSEKLFVCVQERLKKYDEAKKEIQAINGFYNGLKNQGKGGYGNVMLISHEERQGILDIENTVSLYTSFYTRSKKII